MKEEATRHGRKYGYSAQKRWENVWGQRSWGRDKTPPIKGLDGFSKSYGNLRKKADGPKHTSE